MNWRKIFQVIFNCLYIAFISFDIVQWRLEAPSSTLLLWRWPWWTRCTKRPWPNFSSCLTSQWQNRPSRPSPVRESTTSSTTWPCQCLSTLLEGCLRWTNSSSQSCSLSRLRWLQEEWEERSSASLSKVMSLQKCC